MISNETINTISEKLYTEFYRFKRYDTPTTIVLFDSTYEKLFYILEDNIRRTDSYIQVDTQHAVLVLSHTDKLGAIGLIKKYIDMIVEVDEKYYKIGYTEVTDSDITVKEIINRINRAINSDSKNPGNGIIYV